MLRRMLVVWLAVYPTITLLLSILGPHVRSLPVPIQTLILSLIMVALMTILLIPAIDRAITRLQRVVTTPR